MAAKQGLSAQFSQASEDAKRAVLSRTKSPWLHSMNTTCTIKSAPPRSPEVLEMLSTKSGWLYKRNEQHVWQSRFCCVVPHMFLYYFDIEITSNEGGGGAAAAGHHGGEGAASSKPTDEQQELWNHAVKYGYGGKKQSEPRGSLATLFGGNQHAATANNGGGAALSPPSNHPAVASSSTPGGAAAAAADPSTTTTTTPFKPIPSLSSSTPAGIIDLECYNKVNRSSENQLVLELTGDNEEDTDLRSFYFCASNPVESDSWTQALLNGRHSQLLDERDAYQQVCEGFSIQLQELHQKLDESRLSNDQLSDECYRVRSSVEETRRLGWRILRDVLERDLTTAAAASVPPLLQTSRMQYSSELERTPHHELIPALHVWSAYTKSIEDGCVQLYSEQEKLKVQLDQKQDVSLSQLEQLQADYAAKQAAWEREKSEMQSTISTLQSQLHSSQAQLETTRQDLTTQRMEMTMYQTSSKTKISELQNHKKILKREVIELRKTMEDLGSELSLLKHTSATSQSEVQQERRKSELLEKYAKKMERQVLVQQNMMEMMSHNGSDSVRMGDNGSVRMMNIEDEEGYVDYNNHEVQAYGGRTFESERTSPHNNYQVDDDEEVLSRHTELMRRAKQQQMVMVETRPPAEDEKSHLSELTEDRTQRMIEESPVVRRSSNRTPPSYIVGGVMETPPPSSRASREHRGTISGPRSLPPPRRMNSNGGGGRRQQLQQQQRWPSSGSIGSAGSYQPQGRLSVAQRARMEAEQQGGNVIRIRSNSPLMQRGGESPARQEPKTTPTRRHRQQEQNESGQGSPARSQRSFLSKLSDALIVPDDDLETTSSDDMSGRRSYTDEEDRSRSPSPKERRQRDRRRGDGSCPSSPGVSDVNGSNTGSMSLHERQQLQRAQQLRFLKEQGLIKDESNLRGGAGAASPRPRTTMSDTGSIISFASK